VLSKLGTKAQVVDMAVSPTGGRLAVGHANGTVRVW
jgi:hypothetical protein